MVPIRHKACGEIVGWYMRDEPRSPDVMMAADVKLLDGSSPKSGDVFNMACPRCGVAILSPSMIERRFDERKEPKQ